MPNQARGARAPLAFGVEFGFHRLGKLNQHSDHLHTKYSFPVIILMHQSITNDVNCYCHHSTVLLHSLPMAKRLPDDHQGTLNIRGIPIETIFRLKMAAAAEHRTVKGFILALIEEKIQELEKKGLLPKGKG
jgi:hypothetical protein